MGKHDRVAMIEALKPEIEACFGPCEVEPRDLGMMYAVITPIESEEVLHVGGGLGLISKVMSVPSRDCRVYMVECPAHILADWIE